MQNEERQITFNDIPEVLSVSGSAFIPCIIQKKAVTAD